MREIKRAAVSHGIENANVQWDGATAASLARRLGIPNVHLHAEVESTQDIAHALADKGAPAGTLVIADAQRSGRGRLGRSWSSQPGHGVWCTMVARPTDIKALDVLSIRVGLRCAEALDRFAGERVGVKWPNDLLLSRRKLGGILVEARWSGSTLGWVAIGVGVNVVPPPDVEHAAGLSAGVERVAVLQAIVAAVRSASAAEAWLSDEELVRYRARDVLAGRRIVSPATGTVAGITAAGTLLVEGEHGAGTQQFRSGTIRFAEDS